MMRLFVQRAVQVEPDAVTIINHDARFASGLEHAGAASPSSASG